MKTNISILLLSLFLLSSSALRLTPTNQKTFLGQGKDEILASIQQDPPVQQPASDVVEQAPSAEGQTSPSTGEGQVPPATTPEGQPAPEQPVPGTETQTSAQGQAPIGESAPASGNATSTESASETAEGETEGTTEENDAEEQFGPAGPSIIADALALKGSPEGPAQPTQAGAQDEAQSESAEESEESEEEDKGVLTKILDYVKSQVSSTDTENGHANSTNATETAQTNDTTVTQIPEAEVETSQANELGTGITAQDFYIIAQIIAPDGPGTKSYLESLKDETNEEGSEEESSDVQDDQVPNNEEEELELKIPFTPQGRSIGQYEESGDEALVRALPESPFAQEYFNSPQEPQGTEQQEPQGPQESQGSQGPQEPQGPQPQSPQGTETPQLRQGQQIQAISGLEQTEGQTEEQETSEVAEGAEESESDEESQGPQLPQAPIEGALQKPEAPEEKGEPQGGIVEEAVWSEIEGGQGPESNEGQTEGSTEQEEAPSSSEGVAEEASSETI